MIRRELCKDIGDYLTEHLQKIGTVRRYTTSDFSIELKTPAGRPLVFDVRFDVEDSLVVVSSRSVEASQFTLNDPAVADKVLAVVVKGCAKELAEEQKAAGERET